MTHHDSSKSNIEYCKLSATDPVPRGDWQDFTIVEKKVDTSERVRDHFIATDSETSAEAIVKEDYQISGSYCQILKDGDGIPIRRPLSLQEL